MKKGRTTDKDVDLYQIYVNLMLTRRWDLYQIYVNLILTRRWRLYQIYIDLVRVNRENRLLYCKMYTHGAAVLSTCSYDMWKILSVVSVNEFDIWGPVI